MDDDKQNEAKPDPSGVRTCPDCGAPVDCGYAAGRDECWCAAYPPLLEMPQKASARCYCESCLKKRIEAIDATK